MLPGGDDSRTVTVWLMKDSASPEFIERFTSDFEKEHDDIDLDIRIQEWTGIGAKVKKALKEEGGEGPEVIEVGNTQVAQYVDEGGLYDLTLESARDLGMDDWLPGLAEPGRYRGAQYGIPWYAANRVVIYNKDLFAAAGIKTPPRTRAEWLEATEKLNTGGNQGIYLAGQDWYTLSGFIWDEGGELAKETKESSGDWRGTLHTPEALRGMEFYRQLQALGRGPRDADEEHPPQTGVFADGNVAQIVAVPGAARAIEEKNPELKGKLGYFPVPGKKAGKPAAVFTGGSDLVVPEHSDDHKGAVKVIEALAGKKWQTELARTMNYVPNKAKLAPAVADQEGAAAMAVGAANGRATPNSPRWAEVEADNPIKGYMTKVLMGGDPATEARKASARITRALDVGGL
ncbi:MULTISPECIES: extracellular solute-binding protein [Streptomyces]|uniref:Sugar transporter n=1 Tax=Streptomyces venezuelae TaxID=54571 RepID=A0A5P2BPT7_STRVZ|nr:MULTISPECIES: extracellular solute-binding protein [Streptomyces]NEA04929.1 extracellular solute-binding protein [Streptomyces sp. SID10116]MYY83870.1 extracellular solute-binding protein [Streptomyces sp. SID335]MYZ17238.1 extracellular solute-binding protein [Streptomyces sp. SID337]NDZ89009.1 extracellular solute-binding protein [Streptomyces sp. SID10115]NEB44792.1 extracellular solute-binding protein [Streptomyces sp. SID339]